MQHNVKSWPHLFEATLLGLKTHELRNHDRDFKIGDTLLLQEYDPKSHKYTGREQTVEITYITDTTNPCALSDAALGPGYCVLSIRKIS